MIFSIPECNLLCKYCRQEAKIANNPLTNKEFVELGQACVDAGIKRVRWTGGEPTIRKNFPDLVKTIKKCGIQEQYLSTNGTILYKIANDLKLGGIRRVNISIDTFDRKKFYEITGRDLLEDVIKSIKVGAEVFDLVKLNIVLYGQDPEEYLKFLEFSSQFAGKVIPRFIPYGGCEGSELPAIEKGFITTSKLLEAIENSYGSLKETKCEGNNPHARYYEINGLTFGIFRPLSKEDCVPSKFNTLRINPIGYISNDMYNDKIIYIRNLSYAKKVKIIKQLIEEKKQRTLEWYLNRVNVVKPNFNFWRFGVK